MRIALLLISTLLATPLLADDWPRFRGVNNDGHSAEKGLLERWPEGGPKQLWSAGEMGIGWSSASVAGGKIYVTGMLDGEGWLTCLDLTGKRLWRVKYGREWDGAGRWVYPGAHSTPTVDGDRVYLFSGYGRLWCGDAATGETRWAIDTVATFGARNIKWGFAESLLVDDTAVYACPGGPEAAVVKLDKTTGKTIWTCKADLTSAYCSPAFRTVAGKRQLVTMMADGAIGVDPASGALLWEAEFSNDPMIHPNTPVVHGTTLITSITHFGTMAVTLVDGGRSVKDAWDTAEMDADQGGLILLGDRLYGTSTRRPKARLLALDPTSGKRLAQSRAVTRASLLTAGGLLYAYCVKGKVVLLAPTDKGFETRGTLPINAGSGEHWAHPSISGGVLYIRHGSHLMAYKIRGE